MSSYGALYAPPPAPTSPETLALTYGNLSLIPSIAPYLGGEPYEDDKSLSTLPLNQLMNEIGTLASKMFVHRRTFKRIHACCQWLLKTLVSLDGHEQRWDSWVRRVDLLIRNVHHKAREWVDLGVVGSLAMQDNILSEMNGLMGQAEELGIAKHSSVMDELTRRASNDEPKDKKDLDDLLERVLTRHEYRDKAMKLEGEQANLFLNQLVKVVDSRPASDRIRETALAAAYELSITTKSLPSDFEVPSIDDRSSKPILSGRFADIWGADRQGRALALKIPRSEVPEEEHDVLRRFYHEVFLTRYLKHSHIVEFIGITRQYAPQVGIVSPWMVNGMVLDFVADRPMVNRTALVAQIASALGYLHNRENPILHQNIRCENIVINDKGQALLTGFSVSHIRSEMSNTTVTNTRSGFVRWLAPELTTPDTEERPSRASDIWQFSMCILELLTGSHPFMESILHETVTMDLLQGKTPTRPSTWTYRKRGLTEPLWNLLEQCWALDMDSRPSITDMSYTLDHLASQWKFHPHPPPDSPDVNPRSSSPSRFVNRPTSPVPMPDFGVYPPRAATPTSRQYGMSPQRMPLPLSPMASQRPLSPRPSGSRPHSPAIALNEVRVSLFHLFLFLTSPRS
ncbi:kinase-like protein [Sistotremastrum suecicum HHB10207 ss-3]|uniref:Kinase-like protein n=1 Tax=Sistotremastrum suecicum HHB10207 ss-3 TaxID=1314776 RepID=A0A165ZHC7_9AGAM|nr:kinase-like protein [Sistotremastrum suecicum HHB10207 ss-3]